MSDTEDLASPQQSGGPGGEEKVSRKDRKALEKKQKLDEELQRLAAEAGQVNQGDSPFAVTLEQDAVAEGSRNITFNKVSVTVNGKTLFKDTQVKLSAGSRYGLMGPNGRGKSTLLRLLSTRELPVQSNLDVLLVEQEQEFHASDLTAVQAVVQSHKLQATYIKEERELRAKEELTDADMERLKFLEDELHMMGATQAEAKARKILFGLGFPTEWHDRRTDTFSGGWRKRIALASAVYIEPDVLLLDEPTNHLDLNAVIWLESYLAMHYSEQAKRKKTLVVVSHDAGFLDGICTHMVHIESYKLNFYRGGYSGFFAQVEQRHRELDKKYEQFQKRITEMKRKGKSNAQIDEWISEEVRAGRLEEEYLEKRRDYTVTFPFKSPPALRDGCVIKLEEVSFRYPDSDKGTDFPMLFENVNCSLWTDSRITLCGPNGIGKSTLLNLMTGLLEPTSGHISVNRLVRIGRYNQHFVDKLPLEKTATQYIQTLGVHEEHEARRLLGSFGLEGICHNNMIATLSGGQKARVALAAISAEMPHFIIFDEPTNHLDVESIEALCDAINNFKGGVLVVTHDSRLIQETKMQLWVAGNKNVAPFPGDLDDYRAHVRSLFESEEERKERERQSAIDERRELKALRGTEDPKKALAEVRAEEIKAQEEQVQDMFAALDKKKKEKKEKTDKADKADKSEKKEKKDKKDKAAAAAE